MERRAVLKLVALAALTQKLYALPNDAMRDMESAQAAPTATAYTLQFFSEEESRLLDQLMENKKGLAESALQRDEFLQPKENEDEAGLQVFSGLV